MKRRGLAMRVLWGAGVMFCACSGPPSQGTAGPDGATDTPDGAPVGSDSTTDTLDSAPVGLDGATDDQPSPGADTPRVDVTADVTTTDVPVPCENSQFGPPSRFNLPSGYRADTFTSFAQLGRSCATTPGRPGYSLIDANGDQRLDIVVNAACGDDEVGATHWRVYTNSGTGFAETPARFSLPTGYRADTFTSFSQPGRSCAATPGRPGYSLIDINGDRRLDIVVNAACGDDEVGATHWRVYTNSGTGFAETPARFSLPTGYRADTFASFSQPGRSCATTPGRPGYSLIDINGDSRPDIVVNAACGDDEVGATHWRVYTNSGTGFAETPTRFSLPTGYRADTFASFSQPGRSCAATPGRPGYSLLDINGDRRLDIVVNAACGDDEVGATHWRVYTNSGTGFAETPTRFSLPTGYRADTFASLSQPGRSCATTPGRPGYSLIDANGDGRPDIVVNAACGDDEVGASHWRVYINSGIGFAETPARFSLPTGYRADTFASFSQPGRSCGDTPGRPGFSLLDLDADRRPDIVVNAACGDDEVGASHWRLHRNSCM